jgi:ATP-dependent Clp protease ATP-binding subunit ClpB
LVLSDAAREFIARKGFDPVYGARPLRRFLQHKLETRIGRALIAGNVLEGATIRVDVREDALTTVIENPQPEAVGALA